MPKQVTKRAVVPRQEPQIRRNNFNEVALGLSAEDAMKEAARCLQCKRPFCVDGCPVAVPIPEFIELIKEGKFVEAAKKIKEKNSLPAICGRVCPQEKQCEEKCVLGKKFEPVNIGALERFAADQEKLSRDSSSSSTTDAECGCDCLCTSSDHDPCDTEEENNPCTGKKVAIVGTGPAGLTAASDLAKAGCQVTIFEALQDSGGVLRYGIPEFRLPKDILEDEVNYIKSLGVEIKYNAVIGKIFTVDDLFDEGYEAVFIGTGAGLPYFLGLPGEQLNGVYSANEFLTRVNLMKGYKFPEYRTPVRIGRHVCVIGGGNVAMDAARTALRLGAESVKIIYRRSFEEMPARLEEIENAKEEGVEFDLLTNPLEIQGENGQAKAMKCIRMELGEPDASGRRRPVPIEGSEFTVAADTVVVAIGQGPNPILQTTAPQIETNKWGNISADTETGKTSMEGVYAGGDIVTGAATVISAMGAGRRAAEAIYEYLANK